MASFNRLGFAGTPAFAASILSALIDAGRTPVAVWTQPDRRAGRGRKLAHSPVKALAQTHGLPVHQPTSLKSDPQSVQALTAANLDALIVVAYGLILPEAVLSLPSNGCLNVHASLLPRWRGAAPVQAALLAGDAQTGVTIMQMDAGLDTGPMLLKRECAVGPDAQAEGLTEALARLGASALLAALEGLERDELTPEAQDDANSTYAGRIRKSDAKLDFNQPARAVARAVRAYYGWPVAHTSLGGETLRIWAAHAREATVTEAPGTIVASGKDGIDVATSEGVVRVTELQRAGGKRVNAAQFLTARPITAGQQLG